MKVIKLIFFTLQVVPIGSIDRNVCSYVLPDSTSVVIILKQGSAVVSVDGRPGIPISVKDQLFISSGNPLQWKTVKNKDSSDMFMH